MFTNDGVLGVVRSQIWLFEALYWGWWGWIGLNDTRGDFWGLFLPYDPTPKRGGATLRRSGYALNKDKMVEVHLVYYVHKN